MREQWKHERVHRPGPFYVHYRWWLVCCFRETCHLCQRRQQDWRPRRSSASCASGDLPLLSLDTNAERGSSCATGIHPPRDAPLLPPRDAPSAIQAARRLGSAHTSPTRPTPASRRGHTPPAPVWRSDVNAGTLYPACLAGPASPGAARRHRRCRSPCLKPHKFRALFLNLGALLLAVTGQGREAGHPGSGRARTPWHSVPLDHRSALRR